MTKTKPPGCQCPDEFPIERKFVELTDQGFASGVTILCHSGKCMMTDQILRFDAT